MRALRALRLAVIGFVVLMAALVAVSVAEYDTLPEVRPEVPIPVFMLLVGALALLGVLSGCVAILVRKKWGAWLHLASTAVGICAAAFTGPDVLSAASGTIDSLIMIASGFIYGLAFFTPALSSDESEPNQAPEPTPLRVTPAADAPVAPRSVAARL